MHFFITFNIFDYFITLAVGNCFFALICSCVYFAFLYFLLINFIICLSFAITLVDGRVAADAAVATTIVASVDDVADVALAAACCLKNFAHFY